MRTSMSIKVKRKLHDMRIEVNGLREHAVRSNPLGKQKKFCCKDCESAKHVAIRKNKICEQLEHKPVILKSIKRGIYHERKVTGN